MRAVISSHGREHQASALYFIVELVLTLMSTLSKSEAIDIQLRPSMNFMSPRSHSGESANMLEFITIVTK